MFRTALIPLFRTDASRRAHAEVFFSRGTELYRIIKLRHGGRGHHTANGEGSVSRMEKIQSGVSAQSAGTNESLQQRDGAGKGAGNPPEVAI
jgi:hypothetical protein